MKKLIINVFLKFLPKILVDIWDKYEKDIEKHVQGTEYEIDDVLFTALKKAVDALR